VFTFQQQDRLMRLDEPEQETSAEHSVSHTRGPGISLDEGASSISLTANASTGEGMDAPCTIERSIEPTMRDADGKRSNGDEQGIPATLKHARQVSSRDDVWDVVNLLASPVTYSQREFRNLCLLCVEDATKIAPLNKNAWKRGLCNHGHATNAKLHVIRKHKSSPLATKFMGDMTDRAQKRARQSVGELAQHMGQPVAKVEASITAGPRLEETPKKERGVMSFFRPSRNLINSAVANWLMDDGLPYHALTPAFKRMLQVASGNMQLGIMARDTFNSTIEGRFKTFSNAVTELLAYQHERMYGAKFLTLIHDAWTCNRSTGIIGASVAFIDHTWAFRHIALLAAVKNDGHAVEPVSKLIEDRCIEHYSFDIRAMAKWTMSDTTPSARMVTSFYEDSQQEDCSMHILYLCISYGIGLKENIRTRKVPDGSGPLPEGAEVIRKIRALNNYFSTPKHLDQLRKIQEAHGLPSVLPLVDIDVRVASTCRLMRRSVVNYTAMKLCFLDQRRSSVFSCIGAEEWALVSEMEGITQHLAQLALAEVQSQALLASYMLVFRTTADVYLKARSFRCLMIEPPEPGDDDEQTDGRESRLVEKFTKAGQACVARCAAQVRSRFPPLTVNEAVALLLDPRTKNCAGDIIDGMGTPTTYRDKLLEAGADMIVAEMIRLQQL